MSRRHLILDFNWWWIFTMITPVSLYILISYRNSAKTIFMVLTVTIVLYLILALFHHRVHKNLTLEIGLEYVLTAALALIILQSLLF